MAAFAWLFVLLQRTLRIPLHVLIAVCSQGTEPRLQKSNLEIVILQGFSLSP